MRQPIYWKAPPEILEREKTDTDEPVPVEPPSLRISLLKLGGFFLFAFSLLLLLFLVVISRGAMVLLLALPGWMLLKVLAAKVFDERYGWSTEQVGFSVVRIILGVMLGLVTCGVIYSLWRLAYWLLAR